jgi:hypothetical protein
MNIAAATDRPDEFAIVPNKPLETPEDMAALPEPTPGGANRADQTPLQDAVAALGGNPARGRGGVPATDGAIVAHATRLGAPPASASSLRPRIWTIAAATTAGCWSGFSASTSITRPIARCRWTSTPNWNAGAAPGRATSAPRPTRRSRRTPHLKLTTP